MSSPFAPLSPFGRLTPFTPSAGAAFDFIVAADGSGDFTTLAEAEAAAFDGMRLGLRCGGTWREDLDLSAFDGVTVSYEGDPANGLPRVLGTIPLVDSVLWQSSADRADANTNVYSLTRTQAPAEGFQAVSEVAAADAADLSKLGTELFYVNALATCQSTPGTKYSIVQSGGATLAGSQTLYIHPFGSTDPRSDGKRYELTDITRNGAIWLGTNSRLIGVHASRACHAGGALLIGHGGLVEDCVLAECVRHECIMESGTYRRCYGYHKMNDTRTSSVVMEGASQTANGRDMAYEDCVVVTFQTAPGSQSVTAFGGHGSSGTNYNEWTLEGCSAYGATNAVAISSTLGDMTMIDMLARNCQQLGSFASVGVAKPDVLFRDLWFDGQATMATTTWLTCGTTIGTVTFDEPRFFWNVAVGNCFVSTADALILQGGVFCKQVSDAVSIVGNTYGNNLTINGVLFEQTVAGAGAQVGIIADFGTPSPQTLIDCGDCHFVENPAQVSLRFDGVFYSGAAAVIGSGLLPGSTSGSTALTADPANGDFSMAPPPANGAGVLSRAPIYTAIPLTEDAGLAAVIARLAT